MDEFESNLEGGTRRGAFSESTDKKEKRDMVNFIASILCFSFGALLVFVIIGGPILAYLVFGVYFLVKDYAVCEEHSALWIYGIVNIGFLVISTPMQMELAHLFGQGFKPQTKNMLSGLILLIVLVVYGAIVLYGGFTCSEMETHGLWTWALVSFYSHVVISALVMSMISCNSMLEEAVNKGEEEELVERRPSRHSLV